MWGTRVAKTIWKTHWHFKSYYIAVVIKTVCFLQMARHTQQWKRIKNPEGGRRDGSAIQTSCCSSTRPEFSSCTHLVCSRLPVSLAAGSQLLL